MKEKKNKRVKIGFIGGGNMGSAIIAALVRKKIFTAPQIGVCEPDTARLKALRRRFLVTSFKTNADLAASSPVVLLAVKPQQMGEVLEEIRTAATPRHLFLSIAAGLGTPYFAQRLPQGSRVIRIMPNMAAMIGEGAAGLYAGASATRADRTLAFKIFSAAGKAVFVENEDLLDVVTAVSGSGPAFVYLFIDALIEAGASRGLDRGVGRKLVLQTLTGAAKMVDLSGEPIAEMIQKVASKGGTTEAGLKVLEERGFRQIIQEMIDAATHRARELRQVP